MIKMIVFTLLFFLTFQAGYAEKLCALDEILNPIQMAVDGNNIYISDQYKVLIFSMKDFRLIRKIAGKGEGPGEFHTQPLIHITSKHILLHSYLKIALFSKEGELIKEKRLSNMTMSDAEKIGENYVITYYSFTQPSVSKIALLDKNFEEIKILYRYKMPVPKVEGGKKILRLLNPHVFFRCREDKIYIADGHKGFSIETFDRNGNPLGVIRKKLPRIKVTEQYKTEQTENFLRSFSGMGKRKKVLKLFGFRFPEYFPEIMEFSISDGKFYVRTYRQENGKDEYLILDLSGKTIKSVMLPNTSRKGYSFYKNGFYYLRENEAEDVWELHYQNLNVDFRGQASYQLSFRLRFRKSSWERYPFVWPFAAGIFSIFRAPFLFAAVCLQILLYIDFSFCFPWWWYPPTLFIPHNRDKSNH